MVIGQLMGCGRLASVSPELGLCDAGANEEAESAVRMKTHEDDEGADDIGKMWSA